MGDTYSPRSMGSVDDLIFPICRKFFKFELTTEQLAEWVRTELRALGRDPTFNRQQVYPIIAEAARRGYILFFPPLVERLGQRIGDLCDVRPENLKVVQSSTPQGLEDVASSAARLVVDLIRLRAANRCKKERKEKVPVHLGVGAGHTSMLVVKQLGAILRSIEEIEGVEKIVVHSLSSGFSLERPLLSPNGFVNYLSDSVVPMEYIGLFSHTMVNVRDYEEVKSWPGVYKALQHRDEIEIVITSLGSPTDDHGQLVRIEKEYMDSHPSVTPPLNFSQRAGDVQFRLFSNTGPLADDPDWIRAVTLFELEDFVKMVREDKYVVLVSATRFDGATKAQALRPLLTEPSLRVWSHLVLDQPTAREVIQKIEEHRKSQPRN